jgi:hypothetical protein
MQTECNEQAEQRVTGCAEEVGASAIVGYVRCPIGALFEATDARALAECMLFS